MVLSTNLLMGVTCRTCHTFRTYSPGCECGADLTGLVRRQIETRTLMLVLGVVFIPVIAMLLLI